jgi:hypothetical protein
MKDKIIKKITEILSRYKYGNDFAGYYPYDKEEYAEIIYKEVIENLAHRRQE